MIKIVLFVALLAIMGGIAYIRFAPVDPVNWHTDPLDAPIPAMNGWLLRPEGGSAPSPVFATDPATALAAFDAVAMAAPRTIRLAGTVDEGRITYVTRTRLMGFPDYTTVAAIPVENGTALAVYARQGIGSGDWGVNRARVESWLAALDLPPT